jgi:ABC-2 type transport system permease protein
MLDDILTVMWKERKELFHYRGSRTWFLVTLLAPVAMAIAFPFAAGPDWVEGFISVLLSAFIPIILVAITIPDSFAGERERHTLPTLLASRLPDRAILLGKLTIAVASAWGVTLIVLLLGLVTVNIAHGRGDLLMYTPTVALADLTLSFLLATLCAGAGVLISLRSETVQEATQTLTAVFLIPPMLLRFVLLIFVDQLRGFVGALNATQILLIVLAVLAVADLAILTAAMARFKRARLILA